MENNYIWLITANGLPVETHENKSIACAIAAKWNQGTSSKIEVHKVPLYKSYKIDNSKKIKEEKLAVNYLPI